MTVPALLDHVEFVFNRQQGTPGYCQYNHRGVPPRHPPFAMQLPILFLPCGSDHVLAFTHPSREALLDSSDSTTEDTAHINICRCGVVKSGTLFQRQQPATTRQQFPVAIKILDRDQLRHQNDDVVNEVRVMAQLQPAGFFNDYRSPHISQWECFSDSFNEYIAMDRASNGSLLQFAKHRLHQYKKLAVETLVQRMDDISDLESIVNKYIANVWTQEALHIFEGVMKSLAYMHSQRVAHLDLDPCNIVLDREETVRLIDFGSSEIMDEDRKAGANDRLVKFKPLYVAREVRAHNMSEPPRPGFAGAPADMWSAGVLLYQLICLGYPKGHLALVCDNNWRYNLMYHLYPETSRRCLGQQGCLLCFRNIYLPPAVEDILRGLLIRDHPEDRMSASTVIRLLQPLVSQYEVDFHRRAQTALASV